MFLGCINLFSIHYFLWFAAITSIYGYVSVYGEHYAGSTASQYGLLNMVLPFVTIGSKLIFCSLADRHRAYRRFFIVFLVIAFIGYGSFAVMPFFVTPPEKEQGTNYGTFAIICVMHSISTISMSVICCLSDAFAMNSSKKYNTSYGIIRAWGTLGWGYGSLVLFFINRYEGIGQLVPGLIHLCHLLALDILIVCFWTNKEDFKLDESASGLVSEDISDVLRQEFRGQVKLTSFGSTNVNRNMEPAVSNDKPLTNEPQSYMDISSVKMQWVLLKQVAKQRRSIFRYIALFTISGAITSIQWSYLFLYFKEIYQADYTYISAFSMIGQSMLGELPFFILSRYFIQLIGRSHSLSISIASIGVRYLLYAYLLPKSNIYFVLLSEAFQGPSFGLLYVVMTEVALDYSDCEEAIANIVAQGLVANDKNQIDKLRQALRATMQSLMSASYEGLGAGIGSIVGGLMIDLLDFSFLWRYAALTAFILALGNILIDLLEIPILVDKGPRLLRTPRQAS